MSFRYPTAAELAASPDELARARKAEAAPGQGAAVGGGVGTILGGALGALGFLGGPELGIATLPLGASIGGSLGSAAGGAIGNASADADNAALDEAEKERQRKIAELKLRQEALDEIEAAQ